MNVLLALRSTPGSGRSAFASCKLGQQHYCLHRLETLVLDLVLEDGAGVLANVLIMHSLSFLEPPTVALEVHNFLGA